MRPRLLRGVPESCRRCWPGPPRCARCSERQDREHDLAERRAEEREAEPWSINEAAPHYLDQLFGRDA
jgi:hypothetical protein